MAATLQEKANVEKNFKQVLQDTAVNLERLKKVEDLTMALKKAGVPDEELDDYITRQKSLNKADMSISLFTEIVEKANVLTWHDHGKALLKGLSDYAGLDGARKDLEAKVASLKEQNKDEEKLAKEKGKLQAEIASLKLEKATYEGFVAQIPGKKAELDQLKKGIALSTKHKTELEQANAGLESRNNQLDSEIQDKQHRVADLKQVQSKYDKLVKDSADLEEKVKNDQKRWEIFESFLGFVQSTSLGEQSKFAETLPSLVEQVKKNKYSPELLRSYVLQKLTGPALQVLTCSCGLHSTVDMPEPSFWGYKCPVSGSGESSHHIAVDKDASAILNEALAKAKPIQVQLSTIHVLKAPKSKGQEKG